MPTWNDVITRFAQQKPNPRHFNEVEWAATRTKGMDGGFPCRAFCERGTLYSYGKHFVLAYYLGVDKETGKHLFLKTGDANTPTTNKQIREVQSQCYGPTVSMSALATAGIHMPITTDNIVDWRADARTFIHLDKRDGKYYKDFDYRTGQSKNEFKPPKAGMFMPSGHQSGKEDIVNGVWHVLGSALIKYRNKLYLCSMDEGRYFVTELAAPAATVDEAFATLVPAPVKAAIEAGKAVKRQGEWFFVPVGLDDAGLAATLGMTKTKLGQLSKPKSLPREDIRSNTHDVKHVVAESGVTFAKGKVFHRTAITQTWRGDSKPRLTREHATLDMGGVWHEVHKNVQVQSWSMGGNFD